MGRCNLTDTVADAGGRFDAPLLPDGGDPDLDGEDRRLGEPGQLQPRVGLVPQEFLNQRPVTVPRELCATAFDHPAEAAAGGKQSPAHAPPLRPLAAEDKDQLRSLRSGWTLVGRCLAGAGCQLPQRAGQISPVGGHNMIANRSVSPPVGEEGGDVGQADGAARTLQPVSQQTGTGGKGLLAAGCQWHQQRFAHPFRSRITTGRGSRGWRLFQQHMGVGASVAKAIDAGDAAGRSAGCRRDRPVSAGCGNRQAESLKVDCRVRLLEVQMGRDAAVIDHQGCLDQAGDAGGGLEVADVGLHRTDQAGAVGWSPLTHDAADRVGLDGVTDRCAGAMGLDIANLSRRDTGLAAGFMDELLLGIATGNG